MGRYLVFSSIGFELVALILGCYYLGQMLDAKYQTGGMIFVVSSFAGLIAWLIRVIWMVKKFQADDEKNPQDPGKDV
jgi:hypothetical protein